MLQYVYKIRTQNFKSEQAASTAIQKWGDAEFRVMDDVAADHLSILQFFHGHRSR